MAQLPRPALAGDPFHEGYLAAASGQARGSLRVLGCCPYAGGRAAEVWREGVAAWALDWAEGMTPRAGGRAV